MNGVPRSGADRCATAESRVRAYWSNEFTVDEMGPDSRDGTAGTGHGTKRDRAEKDVLKQKKDVLKQKRTF
jgi:hypothetical protein